MKRKIASEFNMPEELVVAPQKRYAPALKLPSSTS